MLLLPSSSMRAGASTPAEAGRCACRSLPGSPAAFPCYWEGRLPHWAFRGLPSVHCTFRPACSLNRPRRPFSPSASTHVAASMNRSAATSWSDSCCAGFAPARRKRLYTAHAYRIAIQRVVARAADQESWRRIVANHADGRLYGEDHRGARRYASRRCATRTTITTSSSSRTSYTTR